jgi:hypothetical protein
MSGHALPKVTYPTKACHSTTAPTLTPLAILVLVPDTQSLSLVCVHASTDTHSHGSSAGMRWLVSHITGSPEPASVSAVSPTQRRNTKHKVETPKDGSNSPTDVRSIQHMAERDSRRSKDPMQGQKTNAASGKQQAHLWASLVSLGRRKDTKDEKTRRL